MPEQEQKSTSHYRIDIGLIIAGTMDRVDQRSIVVAVDQVKQFLREIQPAFAFRFVYTRRPEWIGEGPTDPSALLQLAVHERNVAHWDFAFVLTSAELSGHYSSFRFATLSRPLDAATISLSLIDPFAAGASSSEDERIEQVAWRLSRLLLHALGHLTELTRSSEAENLLFHPADASELDRMQNLTERQLSAQRETLVRIADQRLEEGAGSSLGAAAFALKAAWINRRSIVRSIWAARPWEFPQRLSRLTLASVSTVTILYLTAEAWDLGVSQTWSEISLLVLASFALTTLHVIIRQQLLLRRGAFRSEQIVVTSLSALGIVFAGMLVTWVALAALGFSVSSLLFHRDLIADWAASSELRPRDVTWGLLARMSFFCASLGLLIGALGASFEAQSYFRHIIFVDEEI